MKTYIIYFRVFDKKLKVQVEATSKASARQQVLTSVQFDKIEEERGVNEDIETKDNKDTVDTLKGIFDNAYKWPIY